MGLAERDRVRAREKIADIVQVALGGRVDIAIDELLEFALMSDEEKAAIVQAYRIQLKARVENSRSHTARQLDELEREIGS